MRLLFSVIFVTSLVSCDSGKISTASDSPNSAICGKELNQYIQLVVSDIDAGITSVDAFRLNEAGALSHGSWETNGTAMVASGQTSLGSDAYSSIASTISELSLQNPPDDGTLAQPGGLSYRVVIVAADSIEFQSGSLGAESLIPIIEQWRAASTLSSVSGEHYWSLPIGDSGLETIDIDELGCENPISQMLAEGIVSDSVLLPATETLTAYLEGFSRRPAYDASTPIGRIQFGTVPHQ